MPRDKGYLAKRYGRDHRAERARWAVVVESGQAKCSRCGGVIAPGSRWCLDHEDGVGTSGIYRGVSHSRCNVVASNHKYKDPTPKTSTRW